jgi:threonine dehydrogenase-like Zn-dependent dehydrogenase
VIAAKRLGAEQIIIMGRQHDRTDLARELGATDVVAERGEEAVQRVLELTGGVGVHGVLECVGTEHATETSVAIARPGGGVGRVGVPHYESIPLAQPMFFKNVKIGGGPAPVRAYTARSPSRPTSPTATRSSPPPSASRASSAAPTSWSTTPA